MPLSPEKQKALDDSIDFFDKLDRASRHALYGKLKIYNIPGTDVHLRSWLIDGATRTGKSVCLHQVCHLYSKLGFRVVYFDLPSYEGLNVAEPGFASLPMSPRHGLYKKTLEVHGQPTTIPVRMFRPYLFADGIPVGLGIPRFDFPVPANVEPYTVALSSLRGRDWEALLGTLTRTSRNLLFTAIRNATSETSIQDLILSVESLAIEKHLEFSPDIIGLRSDTPGLQISTRSFDKKSAPGLLSRLESLANAGVILPAEVAGVPVKTNLDVEQIVKSSPWTVFNFPPAAPTELSFGLIRLLVHRILMLDLPTVFVFQELSQFAPRTIPEGQEYFLEPTRSLLRILGSQFAKSGKILVGDTQHPAQIDRILFDAFRYRLHFARQRQDLEETIRADGPVNGQELIANLKLLRDEVSRKGYCVFIPPIQAGCFIRGDAVPPFRTHRTEEPEYDTVCQMEGTAMKSLLPVHNYLTEIVYRIHVRIREQQKEESRQARGAEDAGRSELYLSIAQETLQLSQDKPSMQLLQKDYVDHLMKTFQVSKFTALEYVKRLSSDGIVFVDKSLPRRTMLTFNTERLKRLVVRQPNTDPQDLGVGTNSGPSAKELMMAAVEHSLTHSDKPLETAKENV